MISRLKALFTRQLFQSVTIVFLGLLSATYANAGDRHSTTQTAKLAEFRTLIQRSLTTDNGSGASLAQKLIIKKLEQELLRLGVGKSELENQRMIALAEENLAVAIDLEKPAITAEYLAFLARLNDLTSMTSRTREDLVNEILETLSVEYVSLLFEKVIEANLDVNEASDYLTLAMDFLKSHDAITDNVTSQYDLHLQSLIGKFEGMDKWKRKQLLAKVLAHGSLQRINQLILAGHSFEKDTSLRYENELAILQSLATNNEPITSDIRLTVLKRLNVDTGSNDLGTDNKNIQALYDLIFNGLTELDKPKAIAILEGHARGFANRRFVEVFIDGLCSHPKYLTFFMVKTLYDENQMYADTGYMFDLVRLIRLLPPAEREIFLSSALYYLNRFSGLSSLYYQHPVFMEEEFLDLLAAEIKKDYSTGYIYNLMDKILLRPEYIKRFDIFESVIRDNPHSIAQGLRARKNLAEIEGADRLIEYFYQQIRRATADRSGQAHLAHAAYFSEILLTQNQPYHWDWLLEVLEIVQTTSIGYRVFQSPLIHTANARQLVDALFEKNNSIAKSKLYEALGQKEAAAFPHLIVRMVLDSTVPDKEKIGTLKLDIWSGHPALYKITRNAPITLENLKKGLAEGIQIDDSGGPCDGVLNP